LQRQALRAAGCGVIRAEKASGSRRDGRTELQVLLDFVQPGDTLVVTRIDRLARSLKDLQDIVHELKGHINRPRHQSPQVQSARITSARPLICSVRRSISRLSAGSSITRSPFWQGQMLQQHIMNTSHMPGLNPNADVQYFTWDNAADLATWGNGVDASGGQITLIGHSYGASTAATVVANGLKVQTLVTLDPVGYLQPNFQQVAADSRQWLNYVAAGGGLTLPNAIAGVGSAWNDTTMGHATSTVNVSLDHGGIESWKMFGPLLGVTVQ
jgi:Resolvase, N terminal domain/Alpha/beta hydrolase family